MTRWSALRSLWSKASAAALVIVVVSVPVLAAPAAAREENEDADTFAHYEYRADTETGIIGVTITLEVTADKPNQTVAGGVYQYYLEGYALTIPVSARDVAITTASGASLDYEVVYEDDWFQTLAFGFGRNIFYRQTATVIVTYDLVEDRGDESAITRVNDAYIAVYVWPDPLLEDAAVEVVTPPGFEFGNQFAFATDEFTATDGDGDVRFVADDIDPEVFYTVLSLERPDRLVKQALEVDGHEIVLQSWPGDDAWAASAGATIEEGLPLLIDAIDLDWPIDNELTVTESYDPLLAGYGGWYDSIGAEISLGDVPDDHLILHELSHLWFHNELFSDRWITEGLAETYAADIVADMDGDRPEPESVSLLDSEAIPLSRWPTVGGVEPELEQWAYAASWTVTEAIVDEVGRETMDAVIQAAAANEIAYVGDGEPELSAAPGGWTWYLDLLENRAGESNEELQDLFADWVAAAPDQEKLETRSERRDQYFELVERGDGWAAPLAVRNAMSMWAFTAAAERIEMADALLDRRDALAETVAPLDAELPDLLEGAYEAEDDPSMAEIETAFDGAENAADQLVEANRLVTNATGLFERVGAIGADLDSNVDIAAGAFTSGDFEAVADARRDIAAGVESLARTGMIRVGVAVTVLLVLFGGLVLLRSRRRAAAGQLTGPTMTEPL